MKCAKCGGPLEAEMHGLFEDIEVRRCDRCESGFYPRGTVDRLDDSLTVNAEALDFLTSEGEPLPCPACVEVGYREQAGAPMEALVLPSTFEPFQRCVRCQGLWMADATLDAFRRAALATSNDENESLNERATKKAHGAKWQAEKNKSR